MHDAMRTIFFLALLSSCSESVDLDVVGRVDDYRSWARPYLALGSVPGHGDSCRPIYANDVALSYTHGGPYPEGSIVVKEIRERHADDGAECMGSLKYVGIMRKWDEDRGDPGVPLDGGWIFSYSDGPGGDETYRELCWANCHRQGPWDGAWFDYAALALN